MAAITICSDFGAPPSPKKSLPLFPLFPHLFVMKWWEWMPWSQFSECWALRQLFHSPLSLSSRSSSFSAIKVMSSAYQRLLIFLPKILIPACASSSLAFLMMYSASEYIVFYLMAGGPQRWRLYLSYLSTSYVFAILWHVTDAHSKLRTQCKINSPCDYHEKKLE